MAERYYIFYISTVYTVHRMMSELYFITILMAWPKSLLLQYSMSLILIAIFNISCMQCQSCGDQTNNGVTSMDV